MKIQDLIDRPVITVREDASLEEAARIMVKNGIGCLPVVNAAGDLRGIVTESDFAAKEKGIPFSLYRFPQIFGEWMPKAGIERMYEAARTMPVRSVMTEQVESIGPDAPLGELLQQMLDTGYHRIPVVKAKKPIGVVSRHDLLKLMARSPVTLVAER